MDATSDRFVAYDSSFAAVAGRTPRLWTVIATDAHEGPVYVPLDHALYVTVERGIRRITVAGPSVEDLPAPVVRPNGMFLDNEGRLVVCEQGMPTTPPGSAGSTQPRAS